MKVYFSDFFEVDPDIIEKYGAFNVSLINDLPLFIDPFLLFNSKKKIYQELHENMLKYLRFLRDKSIEQHYMDEPLLKAWYCFPEIKQNWLGFSKNGNGGTGLGIDFAVDLHSNLNKLFADFGDESITQTSHLEKLCLISERAGRDHISNFTTRLINEFLLTYTEDFARKFLRSEYRKKVSVPYVRFNYTTEVWEPDIFELPYIDGDWVMLTPIDMLTKDEAWINKTDLYDNFEIISPSIPDEQLRAQVNNYFYMALKRDDNKQPTKPERNQAILDIVKKYPDIIDYYIKFKEDNGDKAEAQAQQKVEDSRELYINNFSQLMDQLRLNTDFYKVSGDTYREALDRILFLKYVIEDCDGYRIFYIDGKPIKREDDLQIMYRLTWYATSSDVNREVNNGRGPVDYKISRGSKDKTLVEFKLASNTKIKRNLEKQVEIYSAANQTKKAIKVILYFSENEFVKVNKILKELNLEGKEEIILIDARNDNKPSASNA